VTDFKQPCEGLEVLAEAEAHQKEVHQEEAEAQDQSPPLLPKAQYLRLHSET